jgi:DinB superfamily
MSTVTPKDLLLNHLEYTFQREAWQPSLAMAVQGLTAAQVSWKPGPDRHSIWQIVRHVTHWTRAT